MAPLELPPTVVRVWVTPSRDRTVRATLSEYFVVAARELPSGSRMLMLNCDWSSLGIMFLPIIMNRGAMLSTTRRQPTTMVLRWPMDHTNAFV